jgi:ribosomal protein S16
MEAGFEIGFYNPVLEVAQNEVRIDFGLACNDWLIHDAMSKLRNR